MPDGYGVESTTNLVVRCIDTYCFKCAINTLFCTECRTDLGYFLYPETSRCLLNTTLNPKFGIEKAVPGGSVGLVKACADTYCLNCFEDYTVCKACDVSADYYVNLTTSSCVYFNDFPVGWGVNNIYGRAEKCLSDGCLDCFFDKNVCDRCDNSTSIYLDGTVCKDYLTAPFGMGIDYEAGLLAKCSTENCADCKFNHTYCDRCDQSKFYYKMFDKCVYKDCVAKAANCKISLVSSRFDKKSTSAIALLNYDIKSYPELRSYLNISLVNEITGEERILSPEECSFEVIYGGFKLQLNVTYQVLQGTIYIRKNKNLETNPIFDSDQNREFKDFPMRIPNAVVIISKAIQTTQTGTNNIVAVAAMIKSIVGTALMSSSPALAVVMNKVLSGFSYIRLLNGPILIYPSIVLEGFGEMNILPFEIDNPFKTWSSKSICPTNDMQDVFDVKCNLLYNYGEDFITLLLTFAMSTVIYLIFFIMLATVLKTIKKSSLGRKRSILYKLCSIVNESLGYQYFLVVMDGEAQELITYAYINVASPLSDLQLHIGALVSLLLMSFYGYYCYAIYTLAKQVDKKVKRARADWVRVEKGESRTLDSVITFSGMKFEYLSFVYDGYKYPLNLFQLCYPIFGILRILLLCMFLMSFDAAGFTQLSAVLAIEIAFVYLSNKTHVKKSKYEQRLEMMTGVLNSIYIIIKMFTFGPFEYDTKQNYLGIPMAIVLVLVVLVSISFVLFSVVSLLIDAIKKNFLGYTDVIDINEDLEREKQAIRRKDLKRDPNFVYADDIEIPEKVEKRLKKKEGMALAKYKFRKLCIMRNSSSRYAKQYTEDDEATALSPNNQLTSMFSPASTKRFPLKPRPPPSPSLRRAMKSSPLPPFTPQVKSTIAKHSTNKPHISADIELEIKNQKKILKMKSDEISKKKNKDNKKSKESKKKRDDKKREDSKGLSRSMSIPDSNLFNKTRYKSALFAKKPSPDKK
jgi:putative cell wall-binding protein